MTLDEAIENARKVTNSCRKPLMAFKTMNSIVKDNYREENEQLAQWLEELKEYKELEEKLCVMFAGDCRLSDVVENLERQITEPDKDHPVNARILTYEDAEKWNEYLELEEQGRLVKLPCKIGAEVYNTTWWDDVQEKVAVKGKTYYRTVRKHKVTKSTFSYFDIGEFGKTIFLTKEEAEAKLEELRGSND